MPTFYDRIRNAAAIGSASTLGYIHNGPRGARRAGAIVARNLPKMKRKATTTAGTRRRKSAKTFSKKRKVKQVTRRKVKAAKLKRTTAKAVKNIVEKAISKDNPTGHYYKSYGGMSLFPGTAQNKNRVSADVFTEYNAAAGQVVLNRLAYFTPQSLIDAASVLFNNKTLGVETYATTAGNFSDVDLKFNVQYASAKTTFKNQTNADLEFVFMEVRAKDLENDQFLADWEASMTSSNMNQIGTYATASHQNVHPSQIPSLMKRYKVDSVKKILRPGESHVMFQTLAKNFDFQSSDYYDGSTLQKYGKMSVQVIYSYNSVFTAYEDNISAVGDVTRAGRMLTVSGTNAANIQGIVIDVHEKYIIDCPALTSLTYKKDVFCWFDTYQAEESTGSVTNKANYSRPSYTASFAGGQTN